MMQVAPLGGRRGAVSRNKYGLVQPDSMVAASMPVTLAAIRSFFFSCPVHFWIPLFYHYYAR